MVTLPPVTDHVPDLIFAGFVGVLTQTMTTHVPFWFEAPSLHNVCRPLLRDSVVDDLEELINDLANNVSVVANGAIVRRTLGFGVGQDGAPMAQVAVDVLELADE
jgi:hypothetical protein